MLDTPLQTRLSLLARLAEAEAERDSAIKELAHVQERVELHDANRPHWLALYQAACDMAVLLKVTADGHVVAIENSYRTAQALSALEVALTAVEDADALL